MIKGYTYDEFGNLAQSGAGSFLNEVTFTGSVSDTSTGLQYMNARFYDPQTARLLSQDTYSGNPYDPWTQHLYSYAGNNPEIIQKGIDAGKKAVQSVGKVFQKGKDVVSDTSSKANGTTQAVQTYYPPNDGFTGTVEKITLQAGDVIQRIGDTAGRFTAPAGTPWQTLSLPYDKIGQTIRLFEVTQPIEVLAGRVAPWFQQIGGGVQYKLPDTAKNLVDSGFLQ